MIDLYLNNRLNEPTEITRIEFPTYGESFSFVWNTTSPGKLILQANEIYQVKISIIIIRLLILFCLI